MARYYGNMVNDYVGSLMNRSGHRKWVHSDEAERAKAQTVYAVQNVLEGIRQTTLASVWWPVA